MNSARSHKKGGIVDFASWLVGFKPGSAASFLFRNIGFPFIVSSYLVGTHRTINDKADKKYNIILSKHAV